MKELNTFQKYFAEEFYDDYREGLISRRTFIRRLAFITGSMAATVSTMSLLGCSPSELPDPTEPVPAAEATNTSAPDPTATTPPPAPTDAPAEEAMEEEAPSEPVAELQPVPDAQSPFSVPVGDPAVSTSGVTFTSQGDEIMGYLARPVAEGV
ncbi:MAG TPA: hypothetical protein VGD99_14990, partial [Anaerolineae bacterium]